MLREICSEELGFIWGGKPEIIVKGRLYSKEYERDDALRDKKFRNSKPDKSGGGGGGGTKNFISATPAVADYDADCSTDDGAAVQVARHVIGAPPSSAAGPVDAGIAIRTPAGNDWTKVEFGAVIVKNSDGTFGAHNDKIYSGDDPRGVKLAAPKSADISGTWHSHGSGGIENYYPSDRLSGAVNDWQQLQALKNNYAPNNPSYDPSMWITGSDGVTREFKLSQREYFESLSLDQKRSGEGLKSTERSKGCK